MPDNKELQSAANAGWNRWSPIERSLPLFCNSGARVHRISCYCSECGDEIEGDALRGVVYPVVLGERWLVHGFAHCSDCCLLTPLGIQVDSTTTEGGFEIARLRTHHAAADVLAACATPI